MLFNSVEFICIFLPVTVTGFFILGSAGLQRPALLWLVGASFFFYGWWNIWFVPLLAASLFGNYIIGLNLARKPRRVVLLSGVAANLLALGWFKYSGFLVETINMLGGLGLPLPHVVLPLAISFYTFQQIGYLVDAYDGVAKETDFAKYCLFIVFFPQLIAGPIVHHKEMFRQFDRPETYRPDLANIVLGLTVFTIGLFKKVCLADSLSPIANAMYGPAVDGTVPLIDTAWIGAVAFALQLYFDFSGYSDMAIGLGLIFGIFLPINFASPYKAASIIDFWARWHMTLTRFLTAYVYNPIVMGLTKRRLRAGKPVLRRSSPALAPFLVLLATPTLITMALAGIWHGAGWQFIIFGLLHGIMLVLNHAWRALRHLWGIGPRLGRLFHPLGVLLTFMAVTVTLVFFKAQSLAHALTVVRGLVGLYDPSLVDFPIFMSNFDLLMVLVGLAIVWLLPNTQQWLGLVADRDDASREGASAWRIAAWADTILRWRPTALHGAIVGALLCVTLIRVFGVVPSEFLYFTF